MTNFELYLTIINTKAYKIIRSITEVSVLYDELFISRVNLVKTEDSIKEFASF